MAMQRLEARRLLGAHEGIELDGNGQLLLWGTAGDDVLTVLLVDNRVVVTRHPADSDPVSKGFKPSKIKKISVVGRGGNNRISVKWLTFTGRTNLTAGLD